MDNALIGLTLIGLAYIAIIGQLFFYPAILIGLFGIGLVLRGLFSGDAENL